MINKYENRSKISEAKMKDTIGLFTLDIEATKIVLIVKIFKKHY